MTHDERIEAMARALHSAQGNIIPIEMLFSHDREAWRAMATAALAAAGVEEISPLVFWPDDIKLQTHAWTVEHGA
jgi:hypothetical protein